MKFEKIHNKGQAQLFKNSHLEYLTKTHPLVIWGMHLPMIIYLPYYAANKYGFENWRVALIFLAGMFFWTLFEYVMHRFVFHFVSENPRMQRISYLIHGNHHEFPRDKQRLIMPPVPSIISASVVFLLMYPLAGKNIFIFFTNFALAILHQI